MGCEGQGKSVEMRCAVSVPTPETLLPNNHSAFIIPNDNKLMEYTCFSPGPALLHSQLPKPGFPWEGDVCNPSGAALGAGCSLSGGRLAVLADDCMAVSVWLD